MLGKGIIIVAFLCVFNHLQAHDIKVASFNIYLESGQLMCEIKADGTQIFQALDADQCVQTLQYYTDEHLSITFDKRQVKQKVLDYKVTDHFVIISISLEAHTSVPATIEATNTYLIERVNGHENVMIFNLHDRVRSFRQSRERTEITVNY
ncbi:MAG: hypothetical protein JXR03_20750 [Cyclobacteriaceae bacterium]